MKNGYSLIECLLVLVIIGMVTAMAMPGLRSTMSKNKADVAAEKLLASLRFAQTTAHNRHENLSMTIFKNGWQVQSRNTVLLKEDIKHTLHFRSFPANRLSLYFSRKSYQHTDNATFWYCDHSEIRWAIMMNKLGVVSKHLPDENGTILDSKAVKLSCKL